MRGRLDIRNVELFEMLDVTKDPPELVLKGDDFFLREGDTSQSGNMSNIKIGSCS